MRTRKFNLVLLVCSLLTLSAFARSELKPEYTNENGLSCGRTLRMPNGVNCDVVHCFSPQPDQQFSTWNAFEENFLKDEARRSGLLSLPSHFNEICPGHKFFSEEEKELFWFDLIKLIAAYESGYQWLAAYDDIIDRKIVTDRGFFQVAKADCEDQPEVRKDYCAVHWPQVNARCALGIMLKLVRRGKESTLDSLAAAWGTMRPSARNAEGGRREKIKALFMKHPACAYGVSPSARVAPGNATAPSKGNDRRAFHRRSISSADPAHRPRYDRLKPSMYPDSDFATAIIVPSYKPSREAVEKCPASSDEAHLTEQCKRVANWRHYEEVERQFEEKRHEAR
jgi:hypothetical protein